jgi:LmbE family N-acetylglucosaminyl deacetylase
MSFTAITQDNTSGTTGHIGADVDETVGELVERFGPTPITMLAVWSHPDDESLLAGGLLAEVTRRGGRVVNATATSGEHGTDDPIRQPPAVLGAQRGRELSAALAELGIEPAIRLGFEDGTCDRVPDRLGAAVVGALVDQVVPDVVVSFGPDGVTGHPDHRAVARWTRRAVADRGDRIPLVTTAAAAAWPSFCIDRLHSIDAFWPGYPERAGFDRSVGLDADLLDRKLAALGRHASQMAPVEQALGPDGFRTIASIEAYRAANRAAHRHLIPDRTLLAA